MILLTTAVLITGWKVGRASRQIEVDNLTSQIIYVNQQLSQAQDRTEDRQVSELKRTLAEQEAQKLDTVVTEIIGLKTRTVMPPEDPGVSNFEAPELDTKSRQSE